MLYQKNIAEFVYLQTKITINISFYCQKLENSNFNLSGWIIELYYSVTVWWDGVGLPLCCALQRFLHQTMYSINIGRIWSICVTQFLIVGDQLVYMRWDEETLFTPTFPLYLQIKVHYRHNKTTSHAYSFIWQYYYFGTTDEWEC